MYNEEKKWYNQTWFYHNSKYETRVLLDISVASQTDNFSIFSPPSFYLKISNSVRKLYVLNYENVMDLLNTFREVLSAGDPYVNNFTIVKSYNKNKNLEIYFSIDTNNNERIVKITIRNSETDFCYITVPRSVFSCIVDLLKKYINEYIFITNNLSALSQQTRVIELLESNEKLLKTLPFKMIEIKHDDFSEQETTNQEDNPSNSEEVSQLDANSLLSSKELDELDNFLGGEEMTNIKVPEIEESAKENDSNNVVIKSDLIKVLNNDISNYETLINSVYQDNNPLFKLIDSIGLCINFPEDFRFLPGINGDDLKSVCYISNVAAKLQIQNYLINGVDMLPNIPIIKYNAKTSTQQNIELACDLLLINSYLKLMSAKLSDKEQDIQVNKTFLYIISRWYTDVLVYSFIDEDNTEMVKNCMATRFKSYSDIGFFKKYEDLLAYYNAHNITIEEINEIVDKCINASNKSQNISELHNSNFEKKVFKLPSKNELSVEQITNEMVKLEVFSKLNQGMKVDEVIEKYQFDISDVVLNLFKTSKVPRKRIDYGSNLLRYFNFYKTEIPVKIKDEIINYVTELQGNDFDYDKFPLEELPNNIIKGIYTWNESEDKKEKYTTFFSKTEECIDKDLIISKVRTVKELPKENAPWYA